MTVSARQRWQVPALAARRTNTMSKGPHTIPITVFTGEVHSLSIHQSVLLILNRISWCGKDNSKI